MDNVRVRFAPSPTGPLHIGGVRTALYNYLFAKQNNGKLILRIEDTDSTRFVPGAEDYIIEAFQWLGITFDEGVHIPNAEGISYRQSERKHLYKQYADFLLGKKRAYIAFDTPAEIEAKRQEIKNFQYDSHTRMQMKNSLTLSEEEVRQRIESGEQYVIRIRIEPGEDITVHDMVCGEVVINSSILDDKVLWKSSDQLPTYHLANIVDDHLMRISHVIRGSEWLPSAPLHVLLYRYLEWEESMPQFAHLPLLLKPEGNGKLSKRDGDRLGFPVFPLEWHDPKSGETSMGYREQGYYPEAVINFLALLGWNPGTEQEIFTMDELIAAFRLERVSKSGAKFDFEKAKWFNHKYLQMRPETELSQAFGKILDKKGIHCEESYRDTVVSLMKERANFIPDLWRDSAFFFQRPTSYDPKAVAKRWQAETPEHLTAFCQILQNIQPWDKQQAHDQIMQYVTDHECNMGKIMNSLRLCLVGETKGPDIFIIIDLLGVKETVERVKIGIKDICKMI